MRADGVVAIDWGTTNRRIFQLDASGAVIRREADDWGVTSLAAEDFAPEIARLRGEFGDRLFLLAGMVGSNRGWREAPYVPCPLAAPMLAEHLLWVEAGQTAIVPGACVNEGGRADVMRGEEVQLLGAVAAGLVAPDALLCLPGTHAKWARLEDGALTGFRTTMTGELFALLSRHSILAPQLQGQALDSPTFRDGVRRGFDDNAILSDLFGARARMLLGTLRPEDSASYVSGLLIGADLGIGLGTPDETVALIGEPSLTSLYGAAIEEIGCSSKPIDGDRAFLAGIHKLMEFLP